MVELHTSCDSSLLRLALEVEDKVLSRVCQSLEAADITDGVLWSIHMLAVTGVPSHPGSGLFDHPIKELGIASVIGSYILDQKHQSVFQSLLAQRGGINSVQTPRLRDIFQDADIVSSSHNYTAPLLGYTETTIFVLQHLAAQRPAMEVVSAFSVGLEFKEILLDIRVCCKLLEQYCAARNSDNPHARGDSAQSARSSRPAPPRLMLQYRNLIQHRLLSIPRAKQVRRYAAWPLYSSCTV